MNTSDATGSGREPSPDRDKDDAESGDGDGSQGQRSEVSPLDEPTPVTGADSVPEVAGDNNRKRTTDTPGS